MFWVHASNAARFEQSFRDIANCVRIPGRYNKDANIFQLVHDWLHDNRKGRWLLILDNVDDASFLVEAQSTGQEGQADSVNSNKPLLSYLPRCSRGSYLITSRRRDAALRLVEQREIIEIQPMNESDALTLFKRKLGNYDDGNADSKEATELVDALEFMPLAIVQAAAYISQRAPRCSVQQYLEEFRKNDDRKAALLNYNGGEVRRDWEAKNSIMITWQISFDHINSTRPSAANLLSLMSFFDRQGIPEALLRKQSVEGDPEQDQEDNTSTPSAKNHSIGRLASKLKLKFRTHALKPLSRRRHKRRVDVNTDSDHSDHDEDNTSHPRVTDDFEEDISTLRNFSFISINTDKTTFEMHRLVQIAMRKWLELHKQQERWRNQFIRILDTELPTARYENWIVWKSLLPHAKMASAQRPYEKDFLLNWASILFKAGWYSSEMGDAVEAEKMILQSLNIRKSILGEEAPATLYSTQFLASVYEYKGLLERSEILTLQTLNIWKRVSGQEHRSTLNVMNNLASTYMKQERWDEAEVMQLQVLNIRKRVLGQENLDTLVSMNSLAVTYMSQGRWDEAEVLQLQVLGIIKRVLGEEHPRMLNVMNNLASTYMNQGRWEEAEVMQLQVLNTRKKVLGQKHPDTLVSMNDLALTYGDQERWDEAEVLLLQVLNTRKEVLGQEHPHTVITISNLASIYWEQGRWDEAEVLQLQVLNTRKEVLGEKHPQTLNSMNNLACTWKDQGRDAEALDLMSACLELSKKWLGVNHPETLKHAETYEDWAEE